MGEWKSISRDDTQHTNRHKLRETFSETHVQMNMTCTGERVLERAYKCFIYEGWNSMELLMSGPLLAGN